ncbi:MAG: AraC family transcriptional regulator [Ignavibacteriae bacterium]|nr:AraC family transcriptional regulator [Ignavibacteriota bacterium]
MIEPRLDIFSVLIFLGVMQGVFLSIFFFIKRGDEKIASIFLGLLLLILSLFNFDMFLGYSNYMLKVLYLVDFTEPLNFALGPVMYLYVLTTLTKAKQFESKKMLHFAPFLFYLLYSLLFFVQSPEFKYNSFISAFHPELPMLNVSPYFNPDPLSIKANVNLLMIIHMGIYISLAFVQIYKNVKKYNLSGSKTVTFLKLLLWGTVVAMLLVFITRIFIYEDLGEFIIASYNSIVIYSLSFYILSGSSFFREHTVNHKQKYERSALPEDLKQNVQKKLIEIMENEKPFLEHTFSMPILAKKLSVSQHHLSQILNESLNQSFFDLTALYRIEEAKTILSKSQNKNMVIEEVAELVGYNSKSSFNTSFKKITGLTPSQFRNQ